MVELLMFKGDRRPALQPTLTYKDGSVVNLTGCTVKFQLVEVDSDIVVINAAAGIVDPPTSGVVKYEWKAGDTDTLDNEKYRGRFEVTWTADSTKQTFPFKDDFYIYFKEKKGVA